MNDPEELQSIINDLEENNVLTNTYIAEKGKEIERLNAGWHEANVTNLKQAEQLATLQAKLEQAEKDAARYRWLRMGDFDIFGHPHAVDLDGDALDRAVDEAIVKYEVRS